MMSAWSRWLVVITGAVFLVGLAVAHATPGPLLTVDDIAYLAMGRTLAGEGSAPMAAQPPYGSLYPVLLAPGWLLGLAGDGMITYARVVNALLGAATMPALCTLLRRLFSDMTERRALVAATVGTVLPAALLTSSIVWAERLLTLLIVLALLALTSVFDAPTSWAPWTAVGLAVLMFAAHPRLGVAAVVVIAATAWGMRAQGSGAVARVVVTAAVALWCAEWLRSALANATFDSTGTYDLADLASRRGFGEAGQMLQHGLGALTYVVLAGTGLAVWGSVVLARSKPNGWPALTVGAAVLIVAAWFLTGIPRADKWLHGRYIEVMAPVLVAVGISHLHRLRARSAAMLLIGVPALGGVVAAWNGPGNTWAAARSPVMMLGVEVGGAPYGNDIFEPGTAAAVAIVVGLSAWALARWRIEAAGLLLVATCAWGAHSGLETLDQLYERTASAEADERIDPDLEVGELFVDVASVSANLTNALAWQIGFDRSVIASTSRTTHMLLASAATPPGGSVLVAEFSQGTLWELER